MSRSRKGHKAPGFEYWGKRAEGTSKVSCLHSGRIAKVITHRQERRALDRALRREIREGAA